VPGDVRDITTLQTKWYVLNGHAAVKSV